MLKRTRVKGSLGVYCPPRLFNDTKGPFCNGDDPSSCPVCAAWDLAEQVAGKPLHLPNLTTDNVKAESVHIIDFLLQGKPILAVEDNPVSMKLLFKTLDPFKTQVIKANNGQEVMDYVIENGSVGLVLLDMDMPVMNGSEFIDEVLKTFDTLPFPVILVSELSNWQEAKNLIDKGVLSSVKKPYKKEEFYKTIMNSLLTFTNGQPLQ